MKQQSRRRFGKFLAATFVLSGLAAISVVSGVRILRPARRAEAYVARKPVPATPARLAFEHSLDSLAGAIDALQAAIRDRNLPRARRDFRSARHVYKHAEALIEFVAPEIAAILNGPLADADGDAPPRPLGALAAFARISRGLESSGAPDSATLRSLVNDTQTMRTTVAALRLGTAYLRVRPADVLGAARQEVARVTTLDLAGFDLGASEDAIGEAADALDGARALVRVTAADVSPGDTSKVWRSVELSLGYAVTALRKPAPFASVDRLDFIVRFATPASRAIARARSLYASDKAPRRAVWRDESASVFDRDALDASAYAPEYAPAATPALVALGCRLFFDPALSGPQTRSCASCHLPDKAFADGRAVPASLSTLEPSRRNTPTLINAAFQPLLFADQRAGSLEEQIAVVLASPAEMRSSIRLAASRLQLSASYRSEFRDAFASHSDSITELSLRVALAAYVRSLIALASRFDRAVQGDGSALSPVERAGFNVFMGKGRCGTCHFAPLFSGTMPPSFTTSEPEIILSPRSRWRRNTVDSDPGRFAVDHVAEHRFAFKVPTLRNVAVTSPYMHNGAFATLEDVVDFYDRGGTPASSHGPSPTLSAQPLHLTVGEKRALIAFMDALTDTLVAQPYCVARTCVRRSVAKM